MADIVKSDGIKKASSDAAILIDYHQLCYIGACKLNTHTRVKDNGLHFSLFVFFFFKYSYKMGLHAERWGEKVKNETKCK